MTLDPKMNSKGKKQISKVKSLDLGIKG